MNEPNLEFLDAVLVSHLDRLDPTELQVVPAVHDGIDAEQFVVGAVIERYGGAYIRCESSEDPYRRATGPINADMARSLEAQCRGRGLELSIGERDGLVVVETVDGSQPTGSMGTLFSVLSSLASAELDRDFVVLSYSLDGFDRSRAALVWEATLSLRNFPPPNLRTFVPIAGGAVDIEAHCGRMVGSARIVLRDGSTTVRNDDVLLTAAVNRILDRPERQLVLFLGAGASASCRIPQGNRYRDLSLESMLAGTDLEAEFRGWLETNQRWLPNERDLPPSVFSKALTLERVLREEFYSLGGRPRSESATVARMVLDCQEALDRMPDGRRALREISVLLPHLIVATVNFDQLVEHDLPAAHVVLADRGEFERGPEVVHARQVDGLSAALPILKLHGSIERPESLIANIDDTTRGLADEVVATLDSILDGGRPVTWVWIGCSMRDLDVNMWSRRKHGVDDLQEWWVDPLPPASVSEYAFPRAKEWALLEQNLRSRQITETSDRFLVALLARAQELVP